MITIATGNLLDANAEALVNTVNTVGVMGKGIALQFKQAYPEVYDEYRRACEREDLAPGRVLVVPTGRLTNPKFIINFPTKRHWRARARIDDIKRGLRALVASIDEFKIHSVAVPPLGCGNGGLRWNEVRPLIESALGDLPSVEVLLYEPVGTPAADEMRVGTTRPPMTTVRAALIALIERYALPGYRLSMLEVQKLAYFMEVSGEPLHLEFVKQRYGPYSEKLNHVLQRMEGHYMRGYGDRSRSASIRLLPGASEEASATLSQNEKAERRLARVAELIDGFEMPYGMELLATVHWVAQSNPSAKHDSEVAVADVLAWNEHKRRTFQPDHIKIAWSRLVTFGWL